jgi:hypothetical protein
MEKQSGILYELADCVGLTHIYRNSELQFCSLTVDVSVDVVSRAEHCSLLLAVFSTQIFLISVASKTEID